MSQQNIRNNRKQRIDAKLYLGHYYDYMLYKGETISQSQADIEDKSIADFSALDINSGVLYSSSVWSGATNNGVELIDVGFTGMDNGLIHFRKDMITNQEFLDLWEDSVYKIVSGDTRLFLTPITGNTQIYEYPMYLIEEDNEKYISFQGGFYQGFFKLHGFEYEVLPSEIDDEWLLHFEIRPRSDYDTDIRTVNYTHNENEGIFFFMGTRAENKFWPFYKTKSGITESYRKIDAENEGYFAGCGETSGDTYNIKDNQVVFLEDDWLLENEPEIPESYFAIGDDYFAGYGDVAYNDPLRPNFDKPFVARRRFPSADAALNVYDFNPDGGCRCPYGDNDGNGGCGTFDSGWCQCNDYFTDGYYDNKCPEEDNNKIFEAKYLGKGLLLSPNAYEDSEGRAISATGYNEIITDNKFLLFDQTPSGFTVDTWEEGTKVMFRQRRNWPSANYFILMNRTETGYTTDTIDQYNKDHEYDYNIHKDIRNNVFALRVRKDGAIGYRYGILDCNNTEKFSIIEEYSKSGVVSSDVWNTINVKFKKISPTSTDSTQHGLMKIYIYVNGFLTFISKEVPSFKFKELDEVVEKQETVPYNISLGGGSLGLCETILPNYYAISDYILPIEKNFCGTFLGDIKDFRIYKGFISYSSIVNYLS